MLVTTRDWCDERDLDCPPVPQRIKTTFAKNSSPVPIFHVFPPEWRDQDRVNGFTVLESAGDLNKTFVKAPGATSVEEQAPGTGARVQVAEAIIPDLETMEALLASIIEQPRLGLTGATHTGEIPFHEKQPRRMAGKVRRDDRPGYFRDGKRLILPIDIDRLPMPHGLSYEDVPALAAHVAAQMLEPFKGRSFAYHVSGSGGIKAHDKIKLHAFYFADEPLHRGPLREMFQADRERWGLIDPAPFVVPQLIYTARPRILVYNALEVQFRPPDPLQGRRVGLHRGEAGDAVPIAECVHEHAARVARRKSARRRAYGGASETNCFIAAAEEMQRSSGGGQGRSANSDDHERLWDAIAKAEDMGAEGAGYHVPIFKLILASVRNGEEDVGRLIQNLSTFVYDFACENGDLNEYEQKLERYLDEFELERRIEDAIQIAQKEEAA